MLVYWQHKLSHNGVTTYKVFEGGYRSVSENSLSNLKSYKASWNETLKFYQKELENCKTDEKRDQILKDAAYMLSDSDYASLCRQCLQLQTISEATSRKIKKYASKLCYYAIDREFTSKKSGKYKMKVAFLTLTAPKSTTVTQFNKAFELFLDYLRRTAHCTYVWKKEMGKDNDNLHAHVLINNFIPYYIVSWKWKRLLLGEGVEWPLNEKGVQTESHYRIELPKKAKLVAHYISKYMAKGQEVPKEIGRLWGHSAVLDECKEYTFVENELPSDEIRALTEQFKTISDLFFSHVCVNLKRIKEIAPTIFEAFTMQVKEFERKLCFEQKFYIV